MTNRIILSSLTTIALAGPALAQWTQTTSANTPPARSGAMMTFDVNLGRVLMFGGAPAFPAGPLADTWQFDGRTWSPLTPAASPTGRAQAGLAHDINRGVSVMYGGANASPFGGASIDQTWEFNGLTWTRITTAASPGGLASMGMAYDVVRQRVVLYGGAADSRFPIASNQTWEFNGTNWTQVTTLTTPGPLERPGMCYSIALQQVVLFGGIDPQTGGNTNTWAYDGQNWRILNVTGPTPSARTFCQMVYDSARAVCVLHGGMDPQTGAPFNDTWEFDGTSWRQVNLPGPSGRLGFAMANDLANRRVVLFGGEINFNPVSETWQYGGIYNLFGNGCAGSNGVPALVGVGSPHLGSIFNVNLTRLNTTSTFAFMFTGLSNTSWQLGPLPADLTPFGLTGCTTFIRPDLFELVAASNGSAPYQVTIPNDLALVGLPFYHQGASIDPGINPAGLAVTNAGAGIVGH